MEERSPVVDVHAHFVRGIWPFWVQLDRKSTRLNSSHLVISYAVFCLKKKKKNTEHTEYSRRSYQLNIEIEDARNTFQHSPPLPKNRSLISTNITYHQRVTCTLRRCAS